MPTADEIKLAYPIGCVVSVKEEKLSDFQATFIKKVTDRLAEVTSHTAPEGSPVLIFYAYGRRKELRYSMRSPGRYLDIITDMAAIEQWRDSVASTAEKKLARGS